MIRGGALRTGLIDRSGMLPQPFLCDTGIVTMKRSSRDRSKRFQRVAPHFDWPRFIRNPIGETFDGPWFLRAQEANYAIACRGTFRRQPVRLGNRHRDSPGAVKDRKPRLASAAQPVQCGRRHTRQRCIDSRRRFVSALSRVLPQGRRQKIGQMRKRLVMLADQSKSLDLKYRIGRHELFGLHHNARNRVRARRVLPPLTAAVRIG